MLKFGSTAGHTVKYYEGSATIIKIIEDIERYAN